ncbi:MAG: SET domain-containing protein-lysine N-methyltransferase [Gemmatimonadetes bacterium]|nr:SET domain-containing protein-lysine N-methyltransferase [Gemmatimonadota bacterium]
MPPRPSAAVAPLRIRRSAIAGRGAFATRDIRRGERLIEYLGQRISHAIADARYDDATMTNHHTFLFSVSRQTVIDASVNGNDARFINHSCDPNCEAVITRSRVFIIAIKPIAQGDELFYDYAYERDGSETAEDERHYACRCGAKKCRGTILAPTKPKKLKPHHAAARHTDRHV